MSVLEECQKITSFNHCRDETISRKVVGRILEAGRHAPSPGGVQSLEFIVVETDETKEQIEMVVGDDRVNEAPTVIVVLTDRNRMARRIGPEKAIEACDAEAACAVQNMRLVTQENDLSSCWFSGFEGPALGDKLVTPDNVVPAGVVALGYTDNPVPMQEKFAMNDICFYEEYGNQVETFFDGPKWEGISEEKRIFSKKARGLRDKLRRKLEQVL
ncbi:MAG: nitroreductase family protein [Candidatus Nanosalina sp.]